jgi:hypothetical protein
MKDDELIDKLTLPKSAVEAMAKAVPTDLIQAIVNDNRRAAPTPTPPANESKPAEGGVPSALERDLVRVLAGEALDRWFAERETSGPETDYNPFSRYWLGR